MSKTATCVIVTAKKQRFKQLVCCMLARPARSAAGHSCEHDVVSAADHCSWRHTRRVPMWPVQRIPSQTANEAAQTVYSIQLSPTISTCAISTGNRQSRWKLDVIDDETTNRHSTRDVASLKLTEGHELLAGRHRVRGDRAPKAFRTRRRGGQVSPPYP